MKTRTLFNLLLLPLSFFPAFSQSAESGAAIVLNASGLVEAISPDGKKLPGLVKRGSVLTEGFTLRTGAFAESVLLFSNGTVGTISENTTLHISVFTQLPFDGAGQNFQQMQTEPSQSHLTLTLKDGSLIVKTKKLNELSIFSIKTKEGVIRVQGTEFQLASSPSQGIQLDVSESTVSFVPAGRGTPMQISTGSGLDVGKGGPNQRPISPIAAQKISTKNKFASVIAAKIPLSTLKQASQKAQSVAGRSDDSSNESYEEDYAEEEEGGESTGEKALAMTQKSAQVSNSLVSVFSDSENQYNRVIEEITNGGPQNDSGAAGADTGNNGSNTGDNGSNTGNNGNTGDSGTSDQRDKYNLEVNSDDGSVSLVFLDVEADSISISSMEDAYNIDYFKTKFEEAYGDDSMEIDAIGVYVFLDQHFNNAPYDDIYDGLEGALNVAKQVLLVDTTYTDASTWKSTSGSYLYNEFINSGYGEEAALIIGQYASSNNRNSIIDIAQDVFAIFNGNGGADVSSIAFGTTSDTSTVALNTDLLTDEDREQNLEYNPETSISDTPMDTPLTSDRLGEGNGINTEIYKTDLDKLYVVTGRDITLGEAENDTSFDVANILVPADKAADRTSLAITATDDLHLNGNLSFETSHEIVSKDRLSKTLGHDVLLLGAADHIEGMQYNSSEDRQTIENQGTHLVMGSYSDLTAKYVNIKTGGNLAIGSLEDLNLERVSFDAGRANKNDSISLYSDQALNINNPTFDGNAKEIYMQGITINLTDVRFQTNKYYLLRSQLGKPLFKDFAPGHVNFRGDNYWGDDLLLLKDFYELPDAAPVDGWNLKKNTVLSDGTESDIAGIRIRKIQ